MTIRKQMLVGAITALALGVAGGAAAQQSNEQSTPRSFNYEVKDGKRVEKPDRTTRLEDGTIREEYRSGNCVTIKEKRPDGAVKTTRKCD